MSTHSSIAALALAGALEWFGAAPAGAQSMGRVSGELVTGHAGYVDEVWDNRVVGGGLLRVWLTPRVGVGPEVVYQRGPGHDHELLVTGTLSYDLFALNPRRRVAPFLIGGAGMARRSSLVGRGPGTTTLAPYSSREFTASGGLGARIAIGPGIFVSGDTRLGWEPERRFTLTVGWRRQVK